MTPYSMSLAIRVLYFLAQLSPFVSNSLVDPALTHSKSVRRHIGSSTKANILVVRQTNARAGEFTSIYAAAQALKKLHGPQKIYVFPGSYNDQVHIKYKFPLEIQGHSANPGSLSANQVVINVAVSAASKGGDNSMSSALWVQCPRFKLSNVNVINSFGTGTDTQAVALTAEGKKHIYQHCLFSSYQDTVYIKTMASYFYQCRVEGAVDFIFGPGTAWFESSAIAVKHPKAFATITAQQRNQGTNSIFVFNHCHVISMGSSPSVHLAYLGRPWSSYAQVTFQWCYLGDVINPSGWIEWSRQDPRTGHVSFQEYGNNGPGSPTNARRIGTISSGPKRIEDVLGANFWSSEAL